MRILVVLSIILFGVIAADLVVAKTRGVSPGAEAETWAGVGILQVRGGNWCSAALLDQSTVLTAAHCVYPGSKRVLAQPEDVTFLAGWRNGITAAQRSAVRIIAHRDYDPRRPYDDQNIAADIAIVKLDQPVPKDVAQAYGSMDKIRTGEPVSVVSFSGRRSDIASINEGCSAGSRDGNILLLSCESHAGMSGAPIFSYINGKPKIVALISGSRISRAGKNNGIALAVGAPLGRILIDAKVTQSSSRSALPYWSTRAKIAPNVPVTAARKTVTVTTSKGLPGAKTWTGTRNSLPQISAE